MCSQPTPSSLLQPPSSGSIHASNAPCPQDDTLYLRTFIELAPMCYGKRAKSALWGQKAYDFDRGLMDPQQRRLTGPRERRQQSQERGPPCTPHRHPPLAWAGPGPEAPALKL